MTHSGPAFSPPPPHPQQICYEKTFHMMSIKWCWNMSHRSTGSPSIWRLLSSCSDTTPLHFSRMRRNAPAAIKHSRDVNYIYLDDLSSVGSVQRRGRSKTKMLVAYLSYLGFHKFSSQLILSSSRVKLGHQESLFSQPRRETLISLL